jgi:hypothetical protein
MLQHEACVRTDGLVERSASIIKVTTIGELGTTLDVTSNRRTLRRILQMFKHLTDPELFNPFQD